MLSWIHMDEHVCSVNNVTPDDADIGILTLWKLNIMDTLWKLKTEHNGYTIINIYWMNMNMLCKYHDTRWCRNTNCDSMKTELWKLNMKTRHHMNYVNVILFSLTNIKCDYKLNTRLCIVYTNINYDLYIFALSYYKQ